MQLHKYFTRRTSLISLTIVLASAVSALSFTAQPSALHFGNLAATQTAKPTVDPASLITEFEVNGLKVLVKKRASSQTVAAGLFIRGGSRNITAENAGIEELMLDLSSEASANYPREKMRSELASMGSTISSGSNNDYSVLSLACTRSNFDHSWDIFTDVILSPSFAKDDFDRVKSQVVTARQGEDDVPDSLLQEMQAHVAYVGHPYINDAHGTVESLSRITLDDIKRYHKQMMETSRLLMVIVGDLDARQIQKRVAEAFDKLPKGNYQDSPIKQLSFNAATVDVTPRNLPTNYVQGIFAAPALTSPDIYPMRVAIAILRDRVFQEVRVKRNLSYAPNAFLGNQGANTGGIYVTAVDANQSVKVMLNEISRLQNEPISPDDITGIAQQYLTEYYLGQETNAAQAGELATYELIGGGWKNSLGTIDRLRAVTPGDVQRVARTYMKNMRFVVIGNPNSVDKAVFTAQSSE
ncbi:MAG TPA: pitrilysin family protein [Blastocatellia bacterium]|nr:pitrilysin family protein [Blastocatellia bacterium]